MLKYVIECESCARYKLNSEGTNQCPVKHNCNISDRYAAIRFYMPNKEICDFLKEKTQDINDFHTDSDLLDFAENNDVTPAIVEVYLAMKKAEGTPCSGCAYITSLLGYSKMYPCSECSRVAKDYYQNCESTLNSEETK